MSASRPRQGALALALACIGLPVALVLGAAVSRHAANRPDGAIVSDGVVREYLLHVPGSYDPATPTPLVISLHAAGLWPAAQREASGWNRVAEREGFIVVYPSGVSGEGPRVWEANGGADLARDVRFIADLIDTLSAAWNIDPARVYADGISNGGGMAFALSCTLSDRIAAVGMVAPALFLPWRWCPDPRPVPVMVFHGTDDRTTPYHGGPSWVSRGRNFQGIPRWVADGARKNGCAPDPVESRVSAEVTRRAYTGCADDAAVVLYTIHGGGHTWPGGESLPEWLLGPASRDIDATETLWAFFREVPTGPR